MIYLQKLLEADPEEAEKLSGEEYQEQVAEAVAKGIAKCLEYLNEYGN